MWGTPASRTGLRPSIAGRGWQLLLPVLLWTMGEAGAASAQITPGKLHESHAELEGIKNCTKCHALGNQVPSEKCLDCHTLLRERIGAGRGLHARPGHANCAECHIDHNGREFALVYWKDGIEKFVHETTGYGLEGRHQELRCRECHRAEFVTDAAVRRSHEKDLSRTYLGLSLACASCHADVHRGQLASACESCHAPASWRPAAKFDHDRARYRLDGRHESVACAKCHPSVAASGVATGGAATRGAAREGGPRPPDAAPASGGPGPGPALPAGGSFVRYTGLEFGDCVSCHRDVHQGRLAGACASCHTTAGWHEVKTAAFNHDATRYPLRGRHRAVECAACHRKASERALRHETCTDCHADAHRGRFMSTTAGGACERCHTVEGFSPSTYTIAQHRECRYPLTGAHLAVPCVACHLDERAQAATAGSRFAFTFASTACRTCHADPHGGETSRWVETGGCQACHRVESWRAVTFDHGTTRYPLEGRHASVACSGCHRPIEPGARPGRLAFRGLSSGCASCHEDPHAGQFAGGAGFASIACEACHDPRDWRAPKFDHGRDTRFRIDGAHAKTPCAGCHPAEREGERLVVRYRPTPSACESCHAKNVPPPRDRKETR